jgi:hypothetical protein
MTIKTCLPIVPLLLVAAGCGAASARDTAEIQPPKLQGRMGLSPEERIAKINSSNMSEQDKADRIAKIKAESGGK